ncbi:serine/threonine-protein kinase STY17 isoform X1 [Arabidopsis lyrata subsp. lyrata]|uniref:serine/threonine-protein kinase STY17 isoform X1 n=1 Tax=Arabidopsis lyrata subsp. lyrata TaxID=81972 RepID=UPI000A29B01F|nr:serine/threonine-protein kinase STY17 isoform X1 [Arabidopsis lyrata subsp. lyrata]|eukprot:XP_020886585.1 serine/threonine-protein kinase STY17 isoform X1 [Arabidopsis lyrata subsp. lyrata]
MEFLHAHQIMHGDITSSDLLMSKDGVRVIKVSGYGVTGNQKLYTLSMKADVFSYGIFLWELITTETPMSFALEQAKKKLKAKEEDRKPNDFVKQPRNIMETFLEVFRERVPKEASAILVGIMEMCWTEEPPSFAEITKLLRKDSVFRGRQSTDTSERYKKPPGFFHYR